MSEFFIEVRHHFFQILFLLLLLIGMTISVFHPLTNQHGFIKRNYKTKRKTCFHLTPYLEVHLECRWWHFKYCKGQTFWFVTGKFTIKIFIKCWFILCSSKLCIWLNMMSNTKALKRSDYLVGIMIHIKSDLMKEDPICKLYLPCHIVYDNNTDNKAKLMNNSPSIG